MIECNYHSSSIPTEKVSFMSYNQVMFISSYHILSITGKRQISSERPFEILDSHLTLFGAWVHTKKLLVLEGFSLSWKITSPNDNLFT